MTAPSPEWLRRQEIMEHRAPDRPWPWCRRFGGRCSHATEPRGPHICILEREHRFAHHCAVCGRDWPRYHDPFEAT